MAGLKKGHRRTKLMSSDIKFQNMGKDLTGYIYEGNLGRYFYRKNKRAVEVHAGFSGNYSIAMDANIVGYLFDNDIENIFIETEYAIWEIPTKSFIENAIVHPLKSVLLMCPQEHFSIRKKKEEKKEENIPSGKKSFKNSKEVRDQVKDQKERAKKNAEKQKENPIGKPIKMPEKKKYKEGEQTTLF